MYFEKITGRCREFFDHLSYLYSTTDFSLPTMKIIKSCHIGILKMQLLNIPYTTVAVISSVVLLRFLSGCHTQM